MVPKRRKRESTIPTRHNQQQLEDLPKVYNKEIHVYIIIANYLHVSILCLLQYCIVVVVTTLYCCYLLQYCIVVVVTTLYCCYLLQYCIVVTCYITVLLLLVTILYCFCCYIVLVPECIHVQEN